MLKSPTWAIVPRTDKYGFVFYHIAVNHDIRYMESYPGIREQVDLQGFAVLEPLFAVSQIDALLQAIADVAASGESFRKTEDLFAIRKFLREVPAAADLIFTPELCQVILSVFGAGYFVAKAIYFDKPAQSNWFVAYHQDLTISVAEKADTEGFGPWTKKQDQFAVQPPQSILEDNFTVRLHLDDTDEQNGALKVIPRSHKNGIARFQSIDHAPKEEVVCPVRKGGIMLMKPLLMHASGRTVNNRKRRVIHIEFSRCSLPQGLRWAEEMRLPQPRGHAPEKEGERGHSSGM